MNALRVSFRRAAACLLAFFFAAGVCRGEMLSFDRPEDWQTWDFPFGLIETDADGVMRLVEFRRNTNAVEDAQSFSYTSIERDVVSGGIWEVGSNPQDAELVIDGDPETFWQPDPDDEADDWLIDIDLGRAVLASQIRLIFPDREGARPLEQFSVFVNTGTRISVQEDLLLYRPVFRTTLPNKKSSIVIPLSYPLGDTTLVIDGDFDAEEADQSLFRVVHHVLIIADDKNADAALAEVEVPSVGDNISLGTAQRGSFVNGGNATDPINLFDGDMNTLNTVTTGVVTLLDDWQLGTWFRVDLGAHFFIDDMFIYAFGEDEGVLGPNRIDGSGTGHTILFSAGEQSLGTILPGPDRLEYTELFTHENPRSDNLFYIRYRFRPRKMRYLYWHGLSRRGFAQLKWGELMLFAPGHPAEVVLKSDFIDLGEAAGDERAKVIRALVRDADLPPGTRLQLRSRSGNTLGEEYTFYDRAGNLTTEESWTNKPKILRGPIDTTIVASSDWGEWSNFYQLAREPFRSESPRRFVQLELILSTDNPDFTPVVRSLSIEFEDALVQVARGQILPRQTTTNTDTRFRYTLWPGAEVQDSGFDLMRFIVPGPVALDDIGLEIGGSAVVPTAVSMRGDSLFVALPEQVTDDSVRVEFTVRVLQNATVFTLDLGLGEKPGLWQSVEEAERRSTVVMLSDLPDNSQLIGDLSVTPALFTPNGDGINERLEISFVVFKVQDAAPVIQIHDLAGRLVARLAPSAVARRQSFSWSGRDTLGKLVPPGSYLCHIDLGADTGDDVTLRVVAVAY